MICRLIGVRIKELRNNLDMSQEDFAHRIGMARTYFAEVETGKRNVSARNLLKIANGLGITLAHFFDSPIFDQVYTDTASARQTWFSITGGKRGKSITVEQSRMTTSLLVRDGISTGSSADPVSSDETYPVPSDFLKGNPHAYLVRISGRSMDRILPDGCLALVKPCTNANSTDDLYVVSVAGAEATVKRVKTDLETLTLIPDSNDPSFQPITFGRKDPDTVTILGRVLRYTIP